MMTVGSLKKLLEDYPEDTEIYLAVKNVVDDVVPATGAGIANISFDEDDFRGTDTFVIADKESDYLIDFGIVE